MALRLHDVMTPGELVLVHDGGGDRAGSVAAVMRVVDQKLSEGWSFTLPHGGRVGGLRKRLQVAWAAFTQ